MNWVWLNFLFSALGYDRERVVLEAVWFRATEWCNDSAGVLQVLADAILENIELRILLGVMINVGEIGDTYRSSFTKLEVFGDKASNFVGCYVARHVLTGLVVGLTLSCLANTFNP